MERWGDQVIQLHHLETDITQACQLSCVGCNHSVPLWRTRKGGAWSADPVQVHSDLSYFTRVAHASVWGALGGEPTLHPKLVEILHIVRDSGVSDTMEVWSNGITLPKMHPDFWRAFDVLVLSIYEGKLTEGALDWIRKKCQDEGVRLVEKDETKHPNFMTMLEPEPTGPAATKEKFFGCFFRMFSRVLNYGHFFTCCCAPHLPMLVMGKEFGTDGIPVKDLTEEALYEYLNRSEPLGACTICAGRDTAKPLAWHEIKDPTRWLNASRGLTP
jgi:cyclic pyranopterin phosphate synthase